MSEMPANLAKVASFLNEIGLPARLVEEVQPGTFMPGIRIDGGELEFTARCLVSDLLHEAGHLACVPPRFRSKMSGNLSTGQRAMCEKLALEDHEPDGPLVRAVLQCGDTEATAWAWAAGTHLRLPEAQIIQDQDYDGEGAGVRQALRLGAYLGINGLIAAGMCANPRRGGYPEMEKWLQDAR